MTTILYGTPLSLYTGKARGYLIKAGLDYRERTPTTSHYAEVVLPKAGNRRGIPTVELADGEVIRDGTAIIDHFEDASGHQFSPSGFKQNFLSRLFDVIGMEGLLRPAMHYRWNYEENHQLLKFHFSQMVPQGMDRDVVSEKTMDRMRAAGRGFGAVPEVFPLVEALYEEFIDKLTLHLKTQPYLFGHKPAIGDFSMLAPLYAHLGRDPGPLRLMQTRAVELLRWVERMNRPEPDQGEFLNQGEDYLADDEIPSTLIDVLKHVAVDFMPETKAAAKTINQWIEDQEELAAGTTAERAVGMTSFEVRGQSIQAIAQPFRFYLLQRVFKIYDDADSSLRAELDELLEKIDMSELVQQRLTRQIGRKNNLEVWLGA